VGAEFLFGEVEGLLGEGVGFGEALSDDGGGGGVAGGAFEFGSALAHGFEEVVEGVAELGFDVAVHDVGAGGVGGADFFGALFG